MNNITEQLMSEHQNILRVIVQVLIECSRIENGGETDKKFMEQTIDFIRNYADKFHHAKEEDILFEAMLTNVDCLHCNPIPVMLYEHQDGREFVGKLENALKENDKNGVIENARGYCYLLQNHIYKEDNILYPMAEDALDDEQKAQVVRKYKEVECTKFKEEDILKYQKLFAFKESF